MRKIGCLIVFASIILFCFFRFIVVKLAYARYPEDHYFKSFADAMIFAYTKSPAPGGVYHESFGIVSFFENYVYLFCLISVLLGLWMIFHKNKK